MPSPCHGLIWDMDGTLVDTAELHFAAWATLLAELGRGFSRDDFAATFGRRNPEIFAALFGSRFRPEEEAALGERKESFYRAAAAEQGVKLLPGVRELLDGAEEAGAAQAIGSSAPRANLDLILKLTGTADRFQALVGMEDTRRGKPDPQVFLVAAERLGLPPRRCVVFEDAPAGVQAAKAAGMKCVAVAFVGHHSPAKLRAAGADLAVASLAEVSLDAVAQLLAVEG